MLPIRRRGYDRGVDPPISYGFGCCHRWPVRFGSRPRATDVVGDASPP